jgi:hypothetical protein
MERLRADREDKGIETVLQEAELIAGQPNGPGTS